MVKGDWPWGIQWWWRGVMIVRGCEVREASHTQGSERARQGNWENGYVRHRKNICRWEIDLRWKIIHRDPLTWKYLPFSSLYKVKRHGKVGYKLNDAVLHFTALLVCSRTLILIALYCSSLIWVCRSGLHIDGKLETCSVSSNTDF